MQSQMTRWLEFGYFRARPAHINSASSLNAGTRLEVTATELHFYIPTMATVTNEVRTR